MLSTTLIDILTRKKNSISEGITFIEGSDREEFVSYKDLYESACGVLAFLQENGVRQKDELVFQLKDNKTLITVFWAAILGGIIPVPVSIGQNDEHKQKLFNIWRVLNHPFLIGAADHITSLGAFAGKKGLQYVHTDMQFRSLDERLITSSRRRAEIVNAREDDIAFIQFSSGSTGDSKGVILTHKNLLVNVNAISHAAGYGANDSLQSWMPLTHDMGLIGFHLNPLLVGINQFLIPTSVFVRNPSIWLEKVSQHRVTVICSPNFGYKYVLKHRDAARESNLDLSPVRILFNGAEPVSVQLCREFIAGYAPYGLKSHAICPVYGLAEATLAVSIPHLADEIESIDLDRRRLGVGDTITIADRPENGTSFVNVGSAIENLSLRVTDDAARPLPDEVIGHIQIKGACVTQGYYNNAPETQRTITADGWLKTGDLGFIRAGSLYITGRAKDVIFVNGQNFYSHDIERVAEEVDGIELNKIVVSGCSDEHTHSEQVIAFVFHRDSVDDFVPKARALKSHIRAHMGLEIDRVVPVNDIPRTTSGKLERFKLIGQYRRGNFDDVLAAFDRLNEAFDEPADRELSETEKRLVAVWEKALGITVADVDRNFFEMGCTSLKMIELASLISQAFDVDVSVDVLYEHQTIRALAHDIAAWPKTNHAPIPVVHAEDYPASSAQKRMYFVWEANKTSIAYNIPVAFCIQGELKVERLETCIRQMIARHDVLRMSFHSGAGLKFKLLDNPDFSLACVACGPNEVTDILRDMIQPFDLTAGQLFRIKLIRVQGEDPLLFMDFHHIIFDGVSVYHFMGDLLQAYAGRQLPGLPVQFKDYAAWEYGHLRSEKGTIHEAYWREELRGEWPILEMPLDFARPPVFDFAGAKKEFRVSLEQTQALLQIAKANNCTLHTVLFALYGILCSKYTVQDDLVIGIPVASRRHPDLQSIAGMFVNNLAIRIKLAGHESFDTLLHAIKSKIEKGLIHQDYAFEDLVDLVHQKREVGRNPVFDTMFSYYEMDVPFVAESGLRLPRIHFDPGFSKFDISLEASWDEGTLRYGIEYSTRLFKDETIARLGACFQNLMAGVIADPRGRLSGLSMIADAEREQHVHTFNDTQRNIPTDQCIHELFEAWAQRSPTRVAISENHNDITYQELNEKANALAVFLKGEGAALGDLVALLLPRSPQLIISMLGVLKAGCCYLPIDPEFPDEKINRLISNSQCRHLVVSGSSVGKPITTRWPQTQMIDIDAVDLAVQKPLSKSVNVSGADTAYVIYTSGTTEDPKGVMISHRSLLNYIGWAARVYFEDRQTDFALCTPVSFDLTVTSLFVPLITGGQIVIYNDAEGDWLLKRVIQEDRVDAVKLTPSHLKILANDKQLTIAPGSRLRKLIVGGEQLDTDLARDIYHKFNGQIDIYNEYGPTEATVGCMIHRFDPAEAQTVVPIGVPADNTQIYILDKYLSPVPVGVTGELFIAGEGLAKGYLFNEELTNRKFISNPFIPGKKMYCSGDMAKHLPGGTIQFIGRNDKQIKMNGYRVELQEIESYLRKHGGVVDALVTLRANPQGQRNMHAYYLGEKDIAPSVLKHYLAGMFPYYMIPLTFTRIDRMPITGNGKMDYSALPEPVEQSTAHAPQNRIEALSIKIWEDVLGQNNIGVTDNFFDLGGDSIKAVQIAARLFEQGVAIKVNDILIHHTIQYISAQAKMLEPNQEDAMAEGYVQLFPIHAWFLNQHFETPGYYNQSVLLKLERPVNVALLEAAFKRLIVHHDGLRLNLDREKNALFYNNRHVETGFVIPTFDIACREDSGEALAVMGESIKGGFDISSSLLIKAALIKRPDQTAMLLITAHHLVVDGISWRILLADLYSFYKALEKNMPLTMPGKTWTLAEWGRILLAHTQSAKFENERSYWARIDRIPFAIPQDHDAVEWLEDASNKISGRLSGVANYGLHTSFQKSSINMLVMLNTALALTLKAWMGQPWFVIEQENHGRMLESMDISRTVGWFTALYPVRLELPDAPLDQQLAAVKEQIGSVPHQGIGYGLHRYVEGQTPEDKRLSEIRINYLGQFDGELNNDLFSYDHTSHGRDIGSRNTMTVKLELNVMIVNDALLLDIRYNTKAHDESTIHRFKDGILHHLRVILEHVKEQGNLPVTPSDFESVDLDQKELNELFY